MLKGRGLSLCVPVGLPFLSLGNVGGGILADVKQSKQTSPSSGFCEELAIGNQVVFIPDFWQYAHASPLPSPVSFEFRLRLSDSFLLPSSGFFSLSARPSIASKLQPGLSKVQNLRSLAGLLSLPPCVLGKFEKLS